MISHACGYWGSGVAPATAAPVRRNPAPPLVTNQDSDNLKIIEFVSRAPWRKAGSCRHTWPREYVLSLMDRQRELFGMVCARFRAGKGVAATFFGTRNEFLFIGEYKYWLTTHWDAVDLDDGQDYVLNRVRT